MPLEVKKKKKKRRKEWRRNVSSFSIFVPFLCRREDALDGCLEKSCKHTDAAAKLASPNNMGNSASYSAIHIAWDPWYAVRWLVHMKSNSHSTAFYHCKGYSCSRNNYSLLQYRHYQHTETVLDQPALLWSLSHLFPHWLLTLNSSFCKTEAMPSSCTVLFLSDKDDTIMLRHSVDEKSSIHQLIP